MTTRPPPPSGRRPVYAVPYRVFGIAKLRPVVIFSAISAIIWSLVWAGGAFQDIQGDKQSNESKKLVNIDIVLGSLYTGVAAIELFGVFAAITRRTALARLFVGLSLLVILIVASAELMRTVVHFTFKTAIIDECTSQTANFSFWGGGTTTLEGPALTDFCNREYNRSSFSTIVWLILTTLLTLAYASLAHSFYEQLLDPNSFRAPRAPSDQVRLDALHSNQPYGGGYVPYPGFNPAPNYAPPAGAPPPGFGAYAAPPYEGAKLPGYGSELDKDGADDDKKDPEAFARAQHFDAGPSEAELGGLGYRM